MRDTLHHVQTKLDLMLTLIDRALSHCATLQGDQHLIATPHAERDVYHLCARVDATASQLEDTLQTLHRLQGQGVPVASYPGWGEGQPEARSTELFSFLERCS